MYACKVKRRTSEIAMFTMLALHTLVSNPAWAGKYDGMSADVKVSADVPATPEDVFSYLLDLKHLQAMIPCIGSWEMSQRTFGEGASAMVRYDIAAMHRKLPVSLSRADAPYRIDLEHLGNLGFTTVITLATPPSTDGGPITTVTMLTPLNPPPWPVRKYYYDAVQVEWQKCYATTLDNLAQAMRTASPAVASGTR